MFINFKVNTKKIKLFKTIFDENIKNGLDETEAFNITLTNFYLMGYNEGYNKVTLLKGINE